VTRSFRKVTVQLATSESPD